MNRSAGPELAAQLRGHQPDAPDSDGLLLAGDWLGARRALVFLVSDFHFPLETAERVLASLAYHDVVPVVLWDDYEYQDLPHFGLVRVFDPETRRARLLLMRPGLRRRIERNFAARGRALFELFARHGRAPLVLAGGFDADAVTAYFYH